MLAVIGYTGMTFVVLRSINKPVPFLFWRINTVIILAHVALVWVHRYEMQFQLATRNGYSGFIIFHLALLIIIISTIVKEGISIRLIRLSFIIVAAGAVGATFRYDVAEIYKIPVLILTTLGLFGLIKIYFHNWIQKFTL